MSLKKWVLPASLYLAAFAILFTLSYLHSPVSERQASRQNQAQVPTQTTEQALPAVAGNAEATSAEISTGFQCPVQGEILRSLGNYYSSTLQAYVFHAGVDYAEPEGAVIRAGHEGKVVYVGKDVLLGERVTLDCGDGWLVTYGGLQHLAVQEGQSVSPGQALGQVGFDPGSEGQGRPQLHYEVWHNGQSVTP